MLDKAKLGTRYTCFKCGTKFYDLTRPVPSCPDCSADQREAPVRDIQSLLGKGGAVRRYAEEEEEIEGIDGVDDDDDLDGGLGFEGDDDDDDVEIEDDEEMLEEGGDEED